MKKIKDFLLGSDDENEAQTRLREFADRDSARMSYAERNQQAEAGTKVFKLRIRQVLSALAAVGIAWGTYEGVDSLRGNETKEVATIAQITPETPDLAKEFILGGLTFVQDAQLPNEEFERIETLLKKSYAFLAQHLPVDRVEPKKITVSGSGQPTHSQASYNQGTLQVGSKASDGLVVHEFVHLLHGDFDLNHDFVEEGMATALSILASEKLNMESWDRTTSLQLNSSLENALPLRPNVRYTTNPTLLKIRYKKAAYFWIDLERKTPGFIKKFHEAYYAFLTNGGSKEELFNPDVLEKVLAEAGLQQDYTAAVKHNRIAQVKETEKIGEDPKLFAYYVHYSNDDKRQLVVTVAKRTTDGAEQGLQSVQAKFEITNLDTGKTSVQLITAPAKDQVTINLDLPRRGETPLIDWVGAGKRYSVALSVPTIDNNVLTDTFIFEYN